MKEFIAFILMLSLMGCSITDLAPAILPSTNKPSIEANVSMGKTNVQDKSQLSLKGEDKRQIADSINNTETTKAETINQTNISPFIILMLILGWLLPSPNEMWRGFTGLFRVVNTKVTQ
tara:strand:- start:618 stop:974 length:357 start_codon:yes stop_codon:yes gene_type:complete